MSYSKENFFRIIFKWKKTLLIVFACSTILSVFFSGHQFVKPLYKSTAVIYPINLFSYSEESQTEQMLQLLNSRDLHFIVIDTLDLYTHYNIDRKSESYSEKVLKKFNSRVSIKRTQYEAVRIDIYDRSPEMACQIAEMFITSFNNFSINLMKKKANEILQIKESLYFSKLSEVDSLRKHVDSMIRDANLAEYNILKESIRGSYQYLNTGSRTHLTMKTLSEKSLDLFYNQRVFENELENLIKYKNDYEIALSDVNKDLVFSDIISAPSIPQKKAYPIRTIIILTSVFACMFLAFILIIIIERKEFENKGA